MMVRLKSIDDILVNPHMGFTTFQRFNGDPVNPPGQWSEIGPHTFACADDSPVDSWPAVEGFPATSIAYFRWYWSTLMPEPDVIRYDIIEKACRCSAARGQTLDLRIMPHNGTTKVPKWYRDLDPAGKIVGKFQKEPLWLPDYGDPLYADHFGKLVRLLGERFDGDPRINMIDVGMFGHWGEGHRDDGHMPSDETLVELIDILLNAWPKTLKSMLIRDAITPEVTMYACGKGCGWRADCWGDLGNFHKGKKPEDGWTHMLNSYPQSIDNDHIRDAWKNGPISLEVCGTMWTWLRRGFDIDYITDKAIEWHATSVNLKSSVVPDEYWPHVRKLQKKMGYRIALLEIDFPSEAKPGDEFPIRCQWENAGIAPPYHGYPVALSLSGDGAPEQFEVLSSTKEWLPGRHTINKTLTLPKKMYPGIYDVRIALLSPYNGRPCVRLANEGRADDGWYDLGRIRISER